MYYGRKETLCGNKAGEPIAQFHGDIKTLAQYVIDEQSGKGGYAIGIKDGIVLDCYDNHRASLCKASWSNCPSNCFDTVTKKMAKANAYITVDKNKNIVQLRALTNILPHTEILWDYQDEYIYPSLN